jgi:hypothetical protein
VYEEIRALGEGQPIGNPQGRQMSTIAAPSITCAHRPLRFATNALVIGLSVAITLMAVDVLQHTAEPCPV